MMLKLKDAEHSQMVAEMRQRIAELEIENQELITARELQGKGDQADLENTIADLKEEVSRLFKINSLTAGHCTDPAAENGAETAQHLVVGHQQHLARHRVRLRHGRHRSYVEQQQADAE
jgi:hypothetical protein